MLERHIVLVALLAASACVAVPPAEGDMQVPPKDDEPEPADVTPGVDVPYDQAIQASSHNSFERFEPLLDQLVYGRIRSLELDIHDRKEGVDAAPGEWFVFHEDIPLNRYSSCRTLADCLRLVMAFHEAVPQHEVVTLWLDLKSDFAGGHDVADLDAAVSAALGRDNIVTPADLIARCPGATSVRDAVTNGCAFPTLAQLRGRFIVAMTGGTLCDPKDRVAVYGGVAPRERVAFVAPGITGSCPIDAYDAHSDTVMLNLVFEQHDKIPDVRARGLVSRAYRGLVSLNNEDDFLTARQLGTNHIAMDMLNVERDPWATTYSSTGFPFECARCAPPAIEVGSALLLRGTTGDVGGSADSMYVEYAEQTGDAKLDALVSVPSSHVEPDAKACIVARESTAPDAVSVSLCRRFDQGAPVLVVRSARGAASSLVTADAVDGFSAETAAFLRLAIQGSTVVASVSIDGVSWTELSRVSVAVPLTVRGVGVASRTTEAVRAVFANLRGVTLTKRAAVGNGATGEQLATWSIQ
jgi:hypothetical protein